MALSGQTIVDRKIFDSLIQSRVHKFCVDLELEELWQIPKEDVAMVIPGSMMPHHFGKYVKVPREPAGEPYKLQPGVYGITFKEKITKIDPDLVGQIATHPDACRVGLQVAAPFLEAGHEEEIYATLQVAEETSLYQFAVVAQVVFHQRPTSKLLSAGEVMDHGLVTGLYSNLALDCGIKLTIRSVYEWEKSDPTPVSICPNSKSFSAVTWPPEKCRRQFSKENDDDPTWKDYVDLGPGSYLIDFNQHFKPDAKFMVQVVAHKELIRGGALLHTGLVRFTDEIEAILQVVNPFGVRLYRGSAVGQMIFHQVKRDGSE